MKSTLCQRLAFALILLAGTALRLFRLGTDSLWYDETVSVYLAGSPLPELVRHTAGDIHPPGYYALLRGWLLLTGYPTGHADPNGSGLEFVAGFFSLLFGVLLIALVYALASRLVSRRVALTAAALVAFSPYNIWYSQEARMYTLGAALGAIVLYALLRATDAAQPSSAGLDTPGPLKQADHRPPAIGHQLSATWWVIYALAAAAGMYTLYYFAFLLIPINLWALATLLHRQHTVYNAHHAPSRSIPVEPTAHRAPRIAHHVSRLIPWLLANLAAALLYAPWIPVAWRQATDPPVPPWRTAPDLLAALRESWTALSLGQSAPDWLWPTLVLTAVLYALGLVALARKEATKSSGPGIGKTQDVRRKAQYAIRSLLSVLGHPLVLATFGPLALILLVSAVTPLYHVRYLFTYSPTFYVVLAAGIGWLLAPGEGSFAFRPVSLATAWLVAAGVTLHAFWADPAYRADDHRAAVSFLQSHWRPGDVALVNAGYAYTALLTYWQGPVASRTRLTAALPVPREDAQLVLVTTGHMEGPTDLGWGDPRSDFFALPSAVAERQIAALFETFPRVWHYRIYDTVNDPQGKVRAWLEERGQLFEDRIFTGEANMRVQGFVSRRGVVWLPGHQAFSYAAGVSLQPGSPLPSEIAAGQTLYTALIWQADTQPAADIATSLRLIGPDGATWAQPPDERPLGPLFPSSKWPVGQAQYQPLALPIPLGTPPGPYTVALLVYDPATGKPWPPLDHGDRLSAAEEGLNLKVVNVSRPARPPESRPGLARFGPLTLIEATSPATVVAPGGQVPVELLWQATVVPGEPLVVVVQLLGAQDRLAAGLEEEPVKGLYPTQEWAANELVRDRHTLGLPLHIPPGEYRLIVGLYRAADRVRLETRTGLFGTSDYWVVKRLSVR